MLKVGTPAPTFVAESTQGTFRLQDYYGENNIILIFYPKDNTSVCIKQLGEAQAAVEEFKRADTVIAGINQDSLESHRTFAEEQGYSFSLISDPGQKISSMYGLTMMEETPELVERAVFVIDPDGVIRYAAKGHPSINELMDAVEVV